MTDAGVRRASGFAWTIWAATVLIAAARLVLAVVDPASVGRTRTPDVAVGGAPQAAFELVALATIAATGAVVASRQPRNPIGWIFLSIGFFFGLQVLCTHVYWTVALGATSASPAGAAMAWLATWVWIPAMVPALTLLSLYFPTGRPPTPRWRWIQWVVLTAGPLLFLGTAFAPGEFEDFTVENPLAPAGVLGDVLAVAGWVGFALVGLAGLASVASLVVRYRSSTGVERQQIKWVAAAAVLFVVIFAVPSEKVVGDEGGFAILLLGITVIALAVTFSMLRYRLYDIDVVISRTLLVAGLAAFITATYVAIVVGVGSLFGSGDDPNPVLSVLATALVAVAFQPVRRWLRRVANRLVLGRRATPYDVLSGFATRVGGAEASPASLTGLAELMADGTGAQPARVWLRVGDRLRAAASWPDMSPPEEVEVADSLSLPDADLAVPVRDGDELLGALTIAKARGEQVGEVDADLVERLAAASSVLLRNLRLDAELAERLEEIEASRRRLVTAQDDARRRIEAELGGGTRAQLETLARRVAELRPEVDATAAPKTAMLLDQVDDAIRSALDTLAGLAAGVYPPRLAADGLVAALTEQAERSPIRVDVESIDVTRYDSQTEAAVYFAVLESLQNVAKYADAEKVRIRLAQQHGRLTFEVTDDGAGFDVESVPLGSGLQGIVDRLDTVGGSATVVSQTGVGTTVSGVVPSWVGAAR